MIRAWWLRRRVARRLADAADERATVIWLTHLRRSA